MHPRFLGRLGLADVLTLANAALGFAAAALAPADPGIAARLILLGAIADGLDGIVARARGGTAVGQHLDSLADVASFAVAPAVLVFVVAVGVGRLGLYTVYDTDTPATEGVQSTLAATILAAAFLAGVGSAAVLVGASAAFCYLMVAPVTYPELHARDAFVFGGLQALALLAPGALSGAFPRVLLVAALSYLLLAPRFYWREV